MIKIQSSAKKKNTSKISLIDFNKSVSLLVNTTHDTSSVFIFKPIKTVIDNIKTEDLGRQKLSMREKIS